MLSGIAINIFNRLKYPGDMHMEDRWRRTLNYKAFQCRYNSRGMTEA